MITDDALWIAERSKDVSINLEKCQELAQRLGSMDMKIKWRDHPLNPKDLSESTVNWIFVCDILNFSFWTDNGQQPFAVEYKGQMYTGYWSLCACINRALDEGVPILNFEMVSSMTDKQLSDIFRPSFGSDIPLLSDRVRLLKEAALLLSTKYGNSFVNVLRQANYSCQALLNILEADFPSFHDTAVYEGRSVKFAKRSQILVADLWSCFEGQSFGRFQDIGTLTIFADYRIPQILLHFGVLSYSHALLGKLAQHEMLVNKSQEECEIRGCSIHACQILLQMLPNTTAIQLDFFLWDLVNQNKDDFAMTPFHRVRSIYY